MFTLLEDMMVLRFRYLVRVRTDMNDLSIRTDRHDLSIRVRI